MSELGINLDDALQKSIIAIDLSSDDTQLRSYILDTKAELLWMLGRNKEAIEAITLAMISDPESEYFKEQKQKFEKPFEN